MSRPLLSIGEGDPLERVDAEDVCVNIWCARRADCDRIIRDVEHVIGRPVPGREDPESCDAFFDCTDEEVAAVLTFLRTGKVAK